jgi:predicted nucleotidyltransferase
MLSSAVTSQNILLILKPWLEREKDKIVALYGFGSFFSGEFNAESDIDLAILTTEKIVPLVRWAWQNEFANILYHSVDLVDLMSASTVMKAQIIGSSQRLFCQDETRCNFFETYVLSSYARFNESRQELMKDIFERGSVYGR